MTMIGELERRVDAEVEDRGVLRFVTAGSVDDGKSTLIGRLLHDTRQIHADQLAAIERVSLRRGAGALDLSLLTDGLEAEREQGITIDVAYRFFATPRRKFIVADAPGHEQYTRNMATGASVASAAVVLADASKGLLAQTRRHLLIARLLGVRHAIVFVNKMDLVGYSDDAYLRLRAAIASFAVPLEFETLDILPGSALRGDMVVDRGASLGWYTGPTLLERLESLDTGEWEETSRPLRFPVQLVSRPVAGAPRGYMGRLESGFVLAGSEVVVLPAGRRTRIREILTYDGPRELAVAGDSVTLTLADEIDVARGDLIADASRPPREVRTLEAKLVWLDAEPLRPGGRYWLQHATRRTLARVREVKARLDVNTLAELDAHGEVRANDIVRASLVLHAPVYVDAYESSRTAGAFILIDETTHRTVAAGLVQ